ncbi:YigZ family protein [Candidatus Poribacteria bacterium]|nr:YigZ family protein [Candidatus Poribacteria bacterium]
MSDEYKTIVGMAESKLVVKKSRFFGLVTSVDTIQRSKRFLALVQEKYPNASHYCCAYSIGWGREKREYATDAGEPRKSAGPPILAALTASQLSNVVCIVVRYYGGINLGVGGLIRAYGRCARECLASAKIETQIFYKTLQVRTPYEQIGSVLKLCSRLGGKVINVEYDQHATVHLQIRQREVENFQENLRGINADIDVIDPVTV